MCLVRLTGQRVEPFTRSINKFNIASRQHYIILLHAPVAIRSVRSHPCLSLRCMVLAAPTSCIASANATRHMHHVVRPRRLTPAGSHASRWLHASTYCAALTTAQPPPHTSAAARSKQRAQRSALDAADHSPPRLPRPLSARSAVLSIAAAGRRSQPPACRRPRLWPCRGVEGRAAAASSTASPLRRRSAPLRTGPGGRSCD